MPQLCNYLEQGTLGGPGRFDHGAMSFTILLERKASGRVDKSLTAFGRCSQIGHDSGASGTDPD
jgi:hypothetical protein